MFGIGFLLIEVVCLFFFDIFIGYDILWPTGMWLRKIVQFDTIWILRLRLSWLNNLFLLGMLKDPWGRSLTKRSSSSMSFAITIHTHLCMIFVIDSHCKEPMSRYLFYFESIMFDKMLERKLINYISILMTL